MDMERTPVLKLLLKLSPPVMLALLIQSIYNIVDSFFIAQDSTTGLTALSIVYPMQLLMTALATGTGAGVNLLISRMDGHGKTTEQHDVMKTGLILAVFHFLIFAIGGTLLSSFYFQVSSANEIVRSQGILYTKIVFCGSFGLFIESICTKILQARGNMTIPMLAQVLGAVVNIVLDPILIFGVFGSPKLGIAGAAIATIIGQWMAMVLTLVVVNRKYSIKGKFKIATGIDIYKNGIGSIVTQSLYTLYIVGLNMILKGFTEDAVTVLGLYYKIQSFFFIPLLGFQQVLLPVISYNYGANNKERIREIFRYAMVIGVAIMAVATFVFFAIPQELIGIFSKEAGILEIGCYAFPVISISFVPAVFIIVLTSYFQGITRMKESIFIIVLRQVFLLVPLAWILHFWGLQAVWWTFPLTEIIAVIVGIALNRRIGEIYGTKN